MQLAPVTTTTAPRYPTRPPRRSPWRRQLRKLALTLACAASVSLLAACNELEDPFEPRIAGDMPPPSAFDCADDEPESLPELAVPGYHDGELCGTQTAWAALTIEQTATLRLSFPYGVTNVAIDIIDPDGELAGQLNPAEQSLELVMEPGSWLLTATPEDPEGSQQWEYFTLGIEVVE